MNALGARDAEAAVHEDSIANTALDRFVPASSLTCSKKYCALEPLVC